jgi:hypothetical protein
MANIKDPLGLKSLEAAVAELLGESARQQDAAHGKWRSLVSRLDAAHSAFELKMELLRDRYGLLKQTSAQLADEVAWLRDQLDDVASAEITEEPSPGAKPVGDEGRRYSDRWKGRRP